ncbi:MAG: competence/damage-inducible protein A [Eubacteriales bacterium]
MIAEFISVGTELLLGNILNSNAKYLSEQCAELGLAVYYQTVVGDNEKRLEKTIKQAFDRSDVVVLTGGLGPTQDDLTKEVVAKVLDKPLIMHKDTEEKILDFFKSRGFKMSNNNLKQALIPKDSMVLENNNGTAPGLILEENDKIVVLLPGPPKEMKPLFEHYVKPYIRKLSPELIYSKILKVVGVGESLVEEELLDLIKVQDNPTIAPYAKDGEVHLRITAKANTENQAVELIRPVELEIKKRLREAVYTDNVNQSLEGVVVNLLSSKKLTLSTAESCTGGLLSGAIVNCSGVSSVFVEGIITYSNEAKIKRLGVKNSTIETVGAVSELTAKEMVEGVAKLTGSDTALSITGIAGPTGGTEEKPVGLVYIGCYVKGKTIIKKFRFFGSRQKIRNYSVITALNMLRLELI